MEHYERLAHLSGTNGDSVSGAKGDHNRHCRQLRAPIPRPRNVQGIINLERNELRKLS